MREALDYIEAGIYGRLPVSSSNREAANGGAIHQAPPPPPPKIEFPPKIPGACSFCGAAHVALKRGSVCPNGCDDWDTAHEKFCATGQLPPAMVSDSPVSTDPEEEPIPGSVAAIRAENAGDFGGSPQYPIRPGNDYESTPEDPKPAGFPQGDIIPPTD